MAFKQLPFVTALLASVLPGNAIIPGFPYQVISEASSGTGNCWTAASNANGAAVTLQKCQGLATASQAWTFSAGAPAGSGTGGVGTIKIFGNKCLDVTNGVGQPGTKLQIYTCTTGNRNQLWQVTTGDSGIETVQWANSSLCVDLTGGSQASGTPIQIWNCIAGNTNQEWVTQYAAPAPPSPGSTIRLHSQLQPPLSRLLCVTSGTQNNAPVYIDFCDIENPGINWVYQGGSLTSFDGSLCLDVPNGADVDGTKLEVYQCVNGNTNQQWRFNSNFSIQWVGHNKCIDLTNGQLTSGNQLQIYTCFNGNSNQEWAIDPVATS